MVEIYQDYHQEPEDIFLPLPERLRNDFYDLEMDAYSEDLSYYSSILPSSGAILELGCGSGRVTRGLSQAGRRLVGIDLSPSLLQRAILQKSSSTSYLCMNMADLGFSVPFDAIVIAYNTLNLLIKKPELLSCLKRCRELLRPGGILALQLFVPSPEFCASGKKTFQFQIFDRPGGGKIIKEILKAYHPLEEMVTVEERYRVRPTSEGQENQDWSNCYSIIGISKEQWCALFSSCGFSMKSSCGDFSGSSYHPSKSHSFIAVFS
jgi:SAM-dependent methyltransferase